MRHKNNWISRIFWRAGIHAGCAFFCVCTASAQTALSIDDAVRQALINSPELSMAGASIAAKQEYLKAEKRKSWPTLKAELNALRGSGKPTSFAAVVGRQDPDAPTLDTQTGNYGLGSVVLSTPIFRDGAFFFQDTPLETANSETVSQAKSDKDSTIVELSNLVAKAYIDGLSATEQLALQQSALRKEEQRLDGIKRRVLAGLSTDIDEMSMNAALLEKRAEMKLTQRLATYQRMLIAQAMGLGADASIQLIAPPEPFPVLPDLEKTVALFLDRHPDLRAQMAAVNVARSNLAAERAEHWPEVTFELARTEAGDFYTTGTNDFNSAAIKFKATLMDSGHTAAKVRARKYEVDENFAELNQLRATLTKKIYQSFFAYQNAVDAYEASGAGVMKAARQEQESQAKRDKNLTDVDTVLQDQTATLVAQANHVKLRYAAWAAWADLLKSLGLTYSSSFLAAQP